MALDIQSIPDHISRMPLNVTGDDREKMAEEVQRAGEAPGGRKEEERPRSFEEEDISPASRASGCLSTVAREGSTETCHHLMERLETPSGGLWARYPWSHLIEEENESQKG